MVKQDQLWPGGFRFFFDDGLFQPGTDSFLLGSFPRLRRGARVCDLGAGTGLLGLLLLAREPSLQVTNVELQEAAVELARQNAALNGLSDRVANLRVDLRDKTRLPPAGTFDLVVSNLYPFTQTVASGRCGKRHRKGPGPGGLHLYTAPALRRCCTAFAPRRQLLPGVPGGADGRAFCLPAGLRLGAKAAAPGAKYGSKCP